MRMPTASGIFNRLNGSDLSINTKSFSSFPALA
jgi:hypothetical protein